MVEKINKVRLVLYGSLFLGSILGIYAQDIAYYLHDNGGIPLLAGVSLATVFSFLFFLIPPMLLARIGEQNNMQSKEINRYLGVNALIGIVISGFSVIVLIAWWA